MKMFKKLMLVLPSLLLLCTLGGCEKRQAPEEYLKSQIQKIKNGKSELCAEVLQEELELNDIEDFQEELTDGYITFLMDAYKNMKYEVKEADDKGKNRYRVIVSVEPVDMLATVENITQEYLANMQSPNLSTEVKEVMALNQEELSHAVYADKIDIPVRMDWEDKAYTVNKADLLTIAEAAVANKLAPYQMVAEVFDIQKYVQACLDADFKGEFDEYARQTGLSAEEAETQRNENLLDSEWTGEFSFTEEEKGPFTEAIKAFFASASYEVGVPRKSGENRYSVEVTCTPNLSFKKCTEEILSLINSGTISNIEELKQSYLSSMESYAGAPEYGEQTVVTVNVVPNENNRLEITEEDEAVLSKALLPTE